MRSPPYATSCTSASVPAPDRTLIGESGSLVAIVAVRPLVAEVERVEAPVEEVEAGVEAAVVEGLAVEVGAEAIVVDVVSVVGEAASLAVLRVVLLGVLALLADVPVLILEGFGELEEVKPKRLGLPWLSLGKIVGFRAYCTLNLRCFWRYPIW